MILTQILLQKLLLFNSFKLITVTFVTLQTVNTLKDDNNSIHEDGQACKRVLLKRIEWFALHLVSTVVRYALACSVHDLCSVQQTCAVDVARTETVSGTGHLRKVLPSVAYLEAMDSVILIMTLDTTMLVSVSSAYCSMD